jgi:hypothetical protein
MKFTAAFIAVAAAQAPVISLDLDAHDHAGLVSTADARSEHALSHAAVNTQKVHVCAANTASAATDCALPTAKAYDHHDGALKVVQEIELVRSAPKDQNKATCAYSAPVKSASIDYSLRSEYIIRYNAKDASGNAADEVVFAVILEDHTAPVIALSYYTKTVEALAGGQTFSALPAATATDNIDSAMAIATDAKNIDTHTLGASTFKYNTNDFACAFGEDGVSNKATQKSVTITVVDTTPPTTTVTTGTDTVECSKTFTDAGATCVDSHDSYVAGKAALDTSILKTTTTGTVNNMKTGSYTLSYACADFSGNKAATKTRAVTIRDTVAPTLSVCTGGSHAFSRAADWTHSGSIVDKTGCMDHHSIQHSAGYTRDVQIIQFIGNGAKQACTDDCCPNLSVTTSWHSGSCAGPAATFDTLKPASYFVKYSCTDCNSLTTTKCRTLINEDHTKPIIDILGSDTMTIEATYHKNYVDDGATCSDQVDGVISQQVEVSGDVVNLSKVGTYKISYKCKDAAGNAADASTRTVVVKDTTCPTCTITGDASVKREASFPYSDLGAVCTDNIDGNLGAAKVAGTFDVEKVGTYKLTYSTRDESGNAQCKDYIRTIVVQDTLKPVISLHFGGKKIHQSASADKGTNGETNPAGLAASNPNFMAETQTSVNGWVIGAIASAVTGVALLGFSMKKNTVATSVPV